MPTSDPRECFVYVQLPRSLDVVTCGRFRQEGGVGRFVYGKSYLRNPRAVPIDPYELPLQPREARTTRHRGTFGALRDAAPDHWGRRVIERQLGRVDLTELDILLHSPEDRAGALSFGLSAEPPPPPEAFNQVGQLDRLLEEADRIERDLPASPQVAELVNAGSSLGGARPKNVIEDRDGLWVAKFPSSTDRWNNAAVECAMLRLAEECGLKAAVRRVQRVGQSDVLMVRRFDREKVQSGHWRHRMVSALTVLKADEDVQDRARWSYVLFADELRRWVRAPDDDLRELFGRMAFNALISNGDDHPRNHALIAPAEEWELSPAYDLTPQPQSSQERHLAMTAGVHHRRATRANLLSQAARFRMSAEVAGARIDEIKQTVARRWRPLVLECGGTQADCAKIESAFEYPGFEYA